MALSETERWNAQVAKTFIDTGLMTQWMEQLQRTVLDQFAADDAALVEQVKAYRIKLQAMGEFEAFIEATHRALTEETQS